MGNMKYIPLVLFGLFSLKALVTGFNYESAAVLLVAGVIAGFYEYKSNDKKLKELTYRLDLQQKELDQSREILEEVKSSVSSIKLNAQFRTATKLG